MWLALALACGSPDHVPPTGGPTGSSPETLPEGILGAPSVWRDFPEEARATFAGDVDGDGADDLGAGVGSAVELVSPAAQGGDWPDAASELSDPAMVPAWAPLAAAGDVDGDGTSDLWIDDADGSSWLFTGGPAAWTPVATTVDALRFDAAGPRYALEPCDLDGDGGADLVAAIPGGLGAYAGPLAGDLTPEWTLAGGSPALDARVADFDGDGDPDVAAWIPRLYPGDTWGDPGDGDVYVFPAVGAGDRALADADSRLYGADQVFETADWNGDGLTDLVLGGDDDYLVAPLVRVIFGPPAANRDLSLAPDVTLLVDLAGWGEIGSPGDVTGDGADDLVLAGDGGAALYPGGDVGEFAASERAISLSTVASVPLVGRGDLDGDGTRDVAIQAGSLVAIWPGGAL